MRTLITLTALLLTATAAAEKPCASILVGSREETKGGWGNSFSASRTTDLTFAVLLRAAPPGSHLVALKVFTPAGHLYQTLDVPVGGEEGTRKVPGYPRPMKVQKPLKTVVAGAAVDRVDAILPVGGTTISSHSLYGKWRVEAYLDGAPEPCTSPTQFQIRP